MCCIYVDIFAQKRAIEPHTLLEYSKLSIFVVSFVLRSAAYKQTISCAQSAATARMTLFRFIMLRKTKPKQMQTAAQIVLYANAELDKYTHWKNLARGRNLMLIKENVVRFNLCLIVRVCACDVHF